MAQVVEVSGIDVEDAVVKALRQLGLSRDQVEIEVVREGKRGFLRIGAEEAIVRVTAKPSAMPAGAGGRGGDRRRGGPGGRGRGGSRTGGPVSQADAEAEQQRREGVARAALEAEDDDGDLDEDAIPRRSDAPEAAAPAQRGPGDRGDRGPSRGGGRRDREDRGEGDDRRPRGGRGRGGPVRGRASDRSGPIELPVRVPGAPESLPPVPIADPEDEIDLAGRTLRDILNLLGLAETEISARDPETPGDGTGLMSQVFDVHGLNAETSDELGLLIGRRGETLQSLQYLLNVVVSSRYGGDHVFAVDVEEYRRRREQSLVELAQRIAREVRATGDVITLEPMPAAERRIIHLALQDEEGVATESVGEGPNRQVEIMPA